MDNFHYFEFFPDVITEDHCIMVDVPRYAKLMNYIHDIPESSIYTDGHEYGREEHPHITVMYGIEDVAEENAKKILSQIPKKIAAELGEVSKFENPDKPYDVLMIKVRSPHLTSIHNTIKKTCENHWEYGDNYSPHVTLAYVKKGSCNQYVGDKKFSGTKILLDAFVYSNGTREENVPIMMKEYNVGTSGGYGGTAFAGGSVAPVNWAGTQSGPQTSRRLKDYPATRRYTYMQGNTIIGNSLYDTITKDDLNGTPYSPDEMFAGLRYEMKRMEYPDKDAARKVVLQNLQKDPKHYSDLGTYFDSDK